MKRQTKLSIARTDAGPYSTMTSAQLDQIAKPFDHGDFEVGPLTPAMKAAERRAKRKRGRPRVGLGAEKIRISVERGLLRDSDAYARRHGLSRSQLIARSLRATIAGAA